MKKELNKEEVEWKKRLDNKSINTEWKKERKTGLDVKEKEWNIELKSK